MTNTTSSLLPIDSSQQELRRLLLWISDNQKDWDRLCHPESYDPDFQYLSDLVERLYQEQLYTLLLVVLYSNEFIPQVSRAIDRSVKECFLDMPIDALIDRFRKNLMLQA